MSIFGTMNRTAQIKKVSIIGIIANVILAAFKAAVGLISGSIAIILDAVNNLTDALSSGITILGVVLAGKKPDGKHPFGYGRVEYLSSVIISALVLFAGISAAIEAVKRIISPAAPDYSLVTVMVLVGAVAGKIILGQYVKAKGKALGSDALVASGAEAIGDAAISASTLVAIAVAFIWHIDIEGYVAAIISAFIIKAGVELLLSSLSDILGKRAQGELAAEIKAEIAKVDGVLGVYDLVLHDYGPNSAMGSVHVEVDDSSSAVDIHRITNQIQRSIAKRFHIILTVGIYASNNSNAQAVELREYVRSIALAQKGVLGLHGFFWQDGIVSFDIVVDFGCDTAAATTALRGAILERLSDAQVTINIDKNYTE